MVEMHTIYPVDRNRKLRGVNPAGVLLLNIKCERKSRKQRKATERPPHAHKAITLKFNLTCIYTGDTETPRSQKQ
jgi:hypothetical protein